METNELIIKSDALESQTRAEIDISISTAKKYPRDIAKAIKDVEFLACMDKEVAEDCFFALPRAGKTITGESIRFAEIVAQSWGNIKYATRIVGINGKTITAQAVVLDLERNISASVDFEGKITGKDGKMFNEDMIVMTGRAAASKALRNAILQIIPKGLFKNTIEKIKDVAIGKGLELEKTKEKALKYFNAMNIKDVDICKILGVDNFKEITKEHVVVLRGMMTAIKDGDTTVEQLFFKKNVAGSVNSEITNKEVLGGIVEEETYLSKIQNCKTIDEIEALYLGLPDALMEVFAIKKAEIMNNSK